MRRALALAMLALVVHLTALTGLSRCAPAGASSSASMDLDMAGMMHGGHGSTDAPKSSNPDRCLTVAACALAMAPISNGYRVEPSVEANDEVIVPATLIASWIAAPETPPPRV